MAGVVDKDRVTCNNRAFLEEISNDCSKVHNFTRKVFSSDLMDLLEKGPGFVPHQPIKLYDVRKGIKENVYDCVRKLNHISSGKNVPQDVLKLISNSDTYEQTYMLLQDLENVPDIILPHNKCNNTRYRVLRELNSLVKDDTIVINVADKNLGFVINDTEWYVQEYHRMMRKNTKIYRLLPNVDVSKIIDDSLIDLYEIAKKFNKIIPEGDLLYLRNIQAHEVIMPSLSLLPKVHKLKQPAHFDIQDRLCARPIVNGYAAVNHTASRVLHKYIIQVRDRLIEKFQAEGLLVPTVGDRNKFLDNVREIRWKFLDITNKWFVSFDFESLYTNVKLNHVLHTLLSLRELLGIDNQKHRFIVSLCNYVLGHTYFHIGHDRIFKQTSGLAMGSYDSGEVASLVLLYREYLALKDPRLHRIEMLNRYVDDGFVIISGKNPDEVYESMDILFKYYPKDIKIEVKVNKCKIQYLDVYAEISSQTIMQGCTSTKVYQKPFNTYCYPHFQSSVPRSIHKNVIINECKRYKNICSSRMEYDHICKLFRLRLRRCGYPDHYINKFIKSYEHVYKMKIGQKGVKKFLHKVSYDSRLKQTDIVKRILYKYSPYRNKFMLCNILDKRLLRITLTKYKLHSKISKYMY